MKLHFEPNLDYQLQAIEAACDLFRGQETCRTEFTVVKAKPGNSYLPGEKWGLGLGNRRTLPLEKFLENLRRIQVRNGLAPSDALTSMDFTVEMETGTGKTYVYLRTIFELNKRFGFTKFVIVVPSIAIKEGVYKSLQITEDHFRGLYSGVPYGYFLYDSAELGQVRSFATSSNIQIMVVTVGAINKKDVNNLYKDSEKTGGERPIDLVVATNPVIIVDEPQSVDGGLKGRGKEALEAMNPLCTLRYSATHVDKHHMVYRLDAVDAYERKLVKQIEVASAVVEDAHNRPYVRLISVSSKRGSISARVELDVQTSAGVDRQEKTVIDGDDLEQRTGRPLYSGYSIGEIRVAKGGEHMELRLPGGEHFLKPGESWGDVDAASVHREMIRRTIREHLDKEKKLRPQGIKVLSLFFVDHVANYRSYDAEGNAVKGIYAEMFEKEYRRAANLPQYRQLFQGVDLSRGVEEVHNGYFSIDKKGGWIDTAENNQANRENAERAYNLIMRDKEKLLSLETPLKFIFSHSALEEGWDNPNVFQICTLRDIHSERERRQTIGRGLRLCVNQQGERVRGFETNTLTVVARESYEEFAANLQKEIAEDTGVRFGVVEPHQFEAVALVATDGSTRPLGPEGSRELWEYLKTEGLIDEKGKVQDPLREVLKNGTLQVPARFARQRGEIVEMLRRLAGRLDIKNADERRVVRPRRAVLDSPEFKGLWERIRDKTTYRVDFDNERLVEECTNALRDAPAIAASRLQWRTADLAIGKGGVEATERRDGADTVRIDEGEIELPDVLTVLQNRTQLTRRSIHKILVDSGRLSDFKRNPQEFIDIAAEAINRRKQLAIVDGIRYRPLGEGDYYAQELFESEELTGYVKNLLEAQKSVYQEVVYDFGAEENFAKDLESNAAVKVYAKLPGWFEIPTPLGTYNPDWAIVVERDGSEKLYLVVETKGNLFMDALRPKEGAKITCGKAHFKALEIHETPAKYMVAHTLDDVLGRS